MTTPAPLDIKFYQGDSFDLLFRVKARNNLGDLVYQDLTGAVAKCELRTTVDDAAVIAEVTATLTDQVSLTGGVLLHMDDVVTAGITATSGVWDAEIKYANGDRKTMLAGKWTMTKQVTRV